MRFLVLVNDESKAIELYNKFKEAGSKEIGLYLNTSKDRGSRNASLNRFLISNQRIVGYDIYEWNDLANISKTGHDFKHIEEQYRQLIEKFKDLS